ncbi:MAG: ribulose-phosphate 3-epimerase [Firmicutes bacterium]|nr:ribulose-phosphate 3-epimerase [Clostridiales bacterium]MBQ2748047.1 ribulose-phosphate 3-epimerase [Bacillota bacterium]MBQ3122644.1 ribulose-phosphate 3-epimerase [Bacillota bacterium]MBQ9972914.1 ribulose-phosphate 3-epimerase [Bacillota bacterium]
MKLAPSILSADFSKLGEHVGLIEKGGAHLIHVDVMDGHFVPNISFGAPVMKSLLGKTGIPFDVHLMIENPDKYIGDFVTDNTEYITVHQEACTHLHRTIQLIKSHGKKAGVSLNPATSLDTLEYVLEDLDMVLIMSVNPGFGGQKFIPSALRKIRELDEIRKERGLSFEIEVDGGVTLDNVKEVLEAGADIIVAGSAVFAAPDIEERVKEFVKW